MAGETRKFMFRIINRTENEWSRDSYIFCFNSPYVTQFSSKYYRFHLKKLKECTLTIEITVP